MVFFVLSGFFVGSSVVRSYRAGRWSWRWYANQRLTRLYVVLLPAIFLGGVLDHLGASIFGTHGVYGGGGQYRTMILVPITSRDTFLTGIANIFFLQGILAPSYGSNGALWSLSYEFWYYVAFPLLFLAGMKAVAPVRRGVYAVLLAVVLCFIGKNIALYFLIWLMGLLVQRFGDTRSPRKWERPLLTVLSVLLLASLILGRLGTIHNSRVSDLIIGIIFSAFMIFLLRVNTGKVILDGIYLRTMRFLSSISYSLYLLHTPILFFLNALIIRDGNRWQPDMKHEIEAIGIAAIAFAYVWIIWRYTEAKTPLIRKILNPRTA